MGRMMAKYAGVAAAILLAALATAAAAGIGPRIRADEVRHDFGAVKAGVHAEHLFEIRNTGDKVLMIQRVQSS